MPWTLTEQIQQRENGNNADKREQAATYPDLVPPPGEVEIALQHDRVRHLRHRRVVQAQSDETGMTRSKLRVLDRRHDRTGVNRSG